MDQDWFEMPQFRRRKLADAVWIPLRAIHQVEEIGNRGHCGYRSEFYGVGTLAVPTQDRAEASELEWMDIGISHHHCGYFEEGEYVAADVYQEYRGGLSGLHLVLHQRGNSAEKAEWHLHQDFAVTLGLKREADTWVRPDEDYIKVARLSRAEDSSPQLLEVRAAHLRDYLCARGMALYITSYRHRIEVFADASHIGWSENPIAEDDGTNYWEGGVSAIHEGGTPYGAKTAFTRIARSDVDPEEDVPVFGIAGDRASESWAVEHTGRKLYRVQGELWRTEWIEPASQSLIVRRDKVRPTVFFITDAEGTQENRETLVAARRWLWFRPEVMPTLAHRRGGSLCWHTRDTGRVGCSPDNSVHFGVNALGLVNVYAKDIVVLPEWEQKVWAGYNISPEGKVSEELLASQMKAQPADTQAPEAFLGKGLSRLAHLAEEELGITAMRRHEQIPHLLARAHRFRATTKEGLFALAKDLTRLTADTLDASALQQLVAPPKGTKWASLKSLENLLAIKINSHLAREMLSPLVGIYELRHADAHLASRHADEALLLLGVDQDEPLVAQGRQLLDGCVSSIYRICQVLERWNSDEDEGNGI